VPKEKGIRGARSLQDAAIECLLHNISDITFESIECLPVAVLQRVWDIIKTRLVYMALSYCNLGNSISRLYHEEI
jgi:hypothetical protein